MNSYGLLCFVLILGVISQESWAETAYSSSGEVLGARRGESRSDEVGLRRLRPIPGLRPIPMIKDTGFSAENNVDEDELKDLLGEYGIEFITDEERQKNFEQLQNDMYGEDLEKDEHMKKEDAYQNGEKDLFVKESQRTYY
ncbi:uncharacterized protein LOC126884677 [Diabrotica virgifera virgifera]|uniref:Uncharacterized protein LOC114340300 n=1 Tax=Diabrotica virgifera virgifera TaxID=50390 RepID=A0A6P7GC18_DIAVI|nr:uncharacterized protein LOC126884677 [Diabrotica virgifera virgifera]